MTEFDYMIFNMPMAMMNELYSGSTGSSLLGLVVYIVGTDSAK